jgi:hypothetical protein
MPRIHYTLLPSADSKSQPLKLKLSETILMDCAFCSYRGPARVVTGRTEYPLYLCPQCNRRALVIRAKEEREGEQ